MAYDARLFKDTLGGRLQAEEEQAREATHAERNAELEQKVTQMQELINLKGDK